MKIADFKAAYNKKNDIVIAENILEDAKSKLKDVLILGIDKDNSYYFVGNIEEKAKMLLMIEQFKFELLAGIYDNIEDEYDY